ncbi:hypothetical protein AVEN_221995-1, partial [Araneus ventricosus]
VQMNKSSSDFMLYDVADINDPLLSEQLKEINETEETRCRCLAVLRRDLKNLKDIEACLEEDFLLRFLRVSKYDTSKALQRILKYYQNFEIYLDVFKKISFPLHKAESIQHLKLGPYRCRDNSFLIFAKPAIDYKKFTFAQRFYLEILALHQVLEDPVNQICGGTYIIDLEGMDIHGFLAFTPFWVRLFVDSLVFIRNIALKKGIELADNSISERIHVLIGSDYISEVLGEKNIRISKRLIAADSIFGYLLREKEEEMDCKDISSNHLSAENEELDFDRVKDLWLLETIRINPDKVVSLSDKEILK